MHWHHVATERSDAMALLHQLCIRTQLRLEASMCYLRVVLMILVNKSRLVLAAPHRGAHPGADREADPEASHEANSETPNEAYEAHPKAQAGA